MKNPAATLPWSQLTAEFKSLTGLKTTISNLFQEDAERFEKYSIATPELVFDYSKNLVTDDILSRLLELAQQSQVSESIVDLFAGKKVNTTEGRAALHAVLRGHQLTEFDSIVADTLNKMTKFVDSVRDGQWTGYSSEKIRDVVNIGIGGSHLGPAMVVQALQPYSHKSLTVHFISNVDPTAAKDILAPLDPATTLFIIASKSFTTLETHQNAMMARRWFLKNGGDEPALGKHFVAVSSNIEAAEEFGIDAENIFPLWDWVGGRFSLWSAIGLPIALSVGMEHFNNLLHGAHQGDEHFRTRALSENIPVIMALLNIWYRGFFATTSQVILPYSQRLQLFPAFLQQLSMESLGKSVNLSGQPVTLETGAVIWGAPGTDGQHSFHQLLHQGTQFVPADFIAISNSETSEDSQQHAHLLANCFSQSQALMEGKSASEALEELLSAGMDASNAEKLAPHKTIPGNRPSNTFLLSSLTPHNLGFLTSLYENAVYVQSVLWNINAFDQWGVELGKVLSTSIYSALGSSEEVSEFDASTNKLISLAKKWQKNQSAE